MENFPDWNFNFSDEWQEVTLGEISKIFTGTAGDKNFKFIKEDVLVTKDGTIGKIAIFPEYDELKKLNSGIFILRTNSILFPKFLYFVLQSSIFKNFIRIFSVGTAVKHLNQKELKNFKFKIPPLAEQKKISDYPTNFDNAIKEQNKKLLNWRELKKGLLEKIFSREWKFTDDDGNFYPDWQKKTFEEDFCVRMCKRIYWAETSTTGDVPFYKIGTLGRKADKYISKELYERYRAKYPFPSDGDTLITCSGTVGNCVFYDGKPAYFQDSNIVWLEPKTDIKFDKKYLYFYLSQIKWGNLHKTTIARIYSFDLLKKIWLIPCLEEQKKIADYFTEIDKIISAENKILENMRLMKKGLLQKLFPSLD